MVARKIAVSFKMDGEHCSLNELMEGNSCGFGFFALSKDLK
jgi:hypothetical protein